MNKAPAALHFLARCCRKESVGTRIPPTPWIPSMITAAVSVLMASVKAALSLKGRKTISCPALKGATIFGLLVAATAPGVLPWNDFLKAMTFFFPVGKEGRFKGFSFALGPGL